MSAALAIKKLVQQMPLGQIFTTRELIGIGSRASIDKCLHRLVKKGLILRLARGVFSKGDQMPFIAPWELAQIKARAFHKEIYEHAAITASRLGYIPRAESERNEPLTFATNGTGSTSFQSVFGRIRFKPASARKRPQHRNEVWELVKSLWHLGPGGANVKIRHRITMMWGRKSQENLQTYCASIPQWLLEQFPGNEKHAFRTIGASLLKQPATEADAKTCSCPKDDPNCICPNMTCARCQSIPIRNRFSIALG